MNVKGVKLLFFSSVLFCALVAHKDQDRLFVKPAYFPEPHYNFKNNRLTKDKVELGRMLFYDPILSKDNTISCASCHSPYNAFAHTDHALSHGINDQVGKRNAPALFNLAWQKEFMLDGAVNHLDMQALAPLQHPKEMNESISKLVHKLNDRMHYRNAFFKAYNDSIATSERVLKSLSSFQLTLVSAKSKYDLVILGEKAFNDQEERGYKIFKAKCNSCHTEPLFTNTEFKNNGLSIDTALLDFGRGEVTKLAADSLCFKVPTLRNLSFTYPYMHDGRFSKLSQVLAHYNDLDEKKVSKELKPGLDLSDSSKVDLVSFLLTLDDKSFVSNPTNKFPRNKLFKSNGTIK